MKQTVKKCFTGLISIQNLKGFTFIKRITEFFTGSCTVIKVIYYLFRLYY